MPHAIQIQQTGGPEVLNWTTVDVGEPGSGQVRLRQAAAGLNYIDVYHRTGYYSQPLPFIPGLEGAGIVEAIGQAVRGLKVGDRVAYAGPVGGYSEVRLIEADRLVLLPDAISFDQAAAMMLQGMTAQVLIRQVYPVKAGDLILVHAAAGGTGLILCQWAAALRSDRVAYAGPVGGYSEVRLIEADRLVLLPDAISFDQAAAMMLQGMTAQVLIRQVYPVKAGDLILVHAAAGGTGLILCQWAAAL